MGELINIGYRGSYMQWNMDIESIDYFQCSYPNVN